MVTVIKRGTTKQRIKALLQKLRGKKSGIDAHKYSGKITLKEDPITIQKKLRDEWK